MLSPSMVSVLLEWIASSGASMTRLPPVMVTSSPAFSPLVLSVALLPEPTPDVSVRSPPLTSRLVSAWIASRPAVTFNVPPSMAI